MDLTGMEIGEALKNEEIPGNGRGEVSSDI